MSNNINSIFLFTKLKSITYGLCTRKENKWFQSTLLLRSFQALGLHKHEEGHEGHDHEDPLASDSYLWKCVAVIGGLYAFYLFELCMHMIGKGHSHSHGLVSLHLESLPMHGTFIP